MNPIKKTKANDKYKFLIEFSFSSFFAMALSLDLLIGNLMLFLINNNSNCEIVSLFELLA